MENKQINRNINKGGKGLLIFFLILITIPTVRNINLDKVSNWKHLNKSQWESPSSPHTSCGLAVLTNMSNEYHGEDKSLEEVIQDFPPDYGNYYSAEYLKKALRDSGVPAIPLNTYPGSLDLVKDYYIILLIDTFYVSHNRANTLIGRTYSDSFNHYIIVLDKIKYKGEKYFIVFDPYEPSGENIRLFGENQLKYTAGLLVKKEPRRDSTK